MERHGAGRSLLAAAGALCVATASASAAWGPAQNIIPPQYTYGGSWTASNGARSLAVAGDTVHVVWTDARMVLANTGHQVVYKRYDGSAWEGDTVIGYRGNWRNHNWKPSCARDAAGRLHVVWESNDYEFGGGYDLSYTSMLNGIWSGQQQLVASPSNTWHPVIAAADGAVHVCWQDDRAGGFRLYHKALAGAAWGAESAVPGDQVYASFPTMAASGSSVIIAWQDFRTGVFQAHVKELGPAGWGEDSAVSHSSAGAYAPCLACDAGGNRHLAWEDWRHGDGEIYYRRFDRAAGTWGQEVRITSDPWRSRWPVLTCRGDSLVDLFWEDDRGGYCQIMQRSALRGAWSAETTLTAGWADNRAPAAAADGRGNLHLVWSGFGVEPASARPDLFAASDLVNPWPKATAAGGGRRPVREPSALRVHPNPAPGRATISLLAGGSENAVIRIYAVTGQLVRRLRTAASAGGERTALWDGTDDRGRPAAAGAYLVTAGSGSGRPVKLVMVR